MDELLEDSPAGVWSPDHLEGCLRLTLPLGEDDEGPVSATLVSYSPDPEQQDVQDGHDALQEAADEDTP